MNRSTLNLLLIEDDADTRCLAAELLREGQKEAGDGIEIRLLEAAGVEEAVKLHSHARPDAILLDNRLGREKGVDLLPLVKQTWDCPVWMLSGVLDPLLAESFVQKGATGLISKDVVLEDAGQLRSVLLRTLGRT
ncbi:MAG: response regulator [Acidobacteria bacterium]|nr:response regulator [Acidobacteriota bacterium]